MSAETLKILCVDDDEDALTVIRLSLEIDPAIRVHSVLSGAEAVRLIEDGTNLICC